MIFKFGVTILTPFIKPGICGKRQGSALSLRANATFLLRLMCDHVPCLVSLKFYWRFSFNITHSGFRLIYLVCFSIVMSSLRDSTFVLEIICNRFIICCWWGNSLLNDFQIRFYYFNAIHQTRYGLQETRQCLVSTGKCNVYLKSYC